MSALTTVPPPLFLISAFRARRQLCDELRVEVNSRSEDYFFGGYLLTQRAARPEWTSAELLPDKLITASSCIANFVPDLWSVDWIDVATEERKASALSLGIASEALPALGRHVTVGLNNGQFGLGSPVVVKSWEALIGVMKLLPDSREWVALGLALHRNHIKDFLRENAPLGGNPPIGVYEMVVTQPLLPRGGVVLGFEPLGFDRGDPHSWLCNGLEKECFQALGIRPNVHGLIQGEEEARRAVAHISRDEVGAEPVQWLPWMIVDYSRELSKRPT